jgi:purine-nucleoside phosphorylase
MSILSKETLIGAVSLGAGAVISKVVQQKVLTMVPVDIVKTNSNVKNLITLGVGIFTPMIVKGPKGSILNPIGTGLGAGMIASSVAGLVEPLLKSKNIITGTDGNYSDDAFIGDVLMGDSGTMMGSTDSVIAPSTDFSSDASGEMDY